MIYRYLLLAVLLATPAFAGVYAHSERAQTAAIVEEVMRTADDLVRESKILYFGMSDTPAYIMSKANTYARLTGLTP